jgi:hypothetical protein
MKSNVLKISDIVCLTEINKEYGYKLFSIAKEDYSTVYHVRNNAINKSTGILFDLVALQKLHETHGIDIVYETNAKLDYEVRALISLDPAWYDNIGIETKLGALDL